MRILPSCEIEMAWQEYQRKLDRATLIFFVIGVIIHMAEYKYFMWKIACYC